MNNRATRKWRIASWRVVGWVTGAGDVIPVEEIKPDRLDRIIHRIEHGNNGEIIEDTPLMHRLRQLDNHDE